MLRAALAGFAGAVIGWALGSRRGRANRAERAAGRARAKDCAGWVSSSGRPLDPESARVMCPVYHDIARWNLDQYYKYVTYCGGAIGALLVWAVGIFVGNQSDKWSAIVALVGPLASWLRWNVSKLLDKQYKRWLQNLVLAAKCEYIMGLHGAVRPPAEERAGERPWPKDETFQVQSFYRDRTSRCWPTSAGFVCAQLSKPGNLREVGQRTLLGLEVVAWVFAAVVAINWGCLMWAAAGR